MLSKAKLGNDLYEGGRAGVSENQANHQIDIDCSSVEIETD